MTQGTLKESTWKAKETFSPLCHLTVFLFILSSNHPIVKEFFNMVDLLELQKEFLRKRIGKGSVVCESAAGNGHDSEFLSKTVGETGRLCTPLTYSPPPANRRKIHLAESGCPQNYTIINDSHANCKEYVHEKINAGMFNLGWLPGSDRKVTTRRESTLKAVNAAIELLAPDGL